MTTPSAHRKGVSTAVGDDTKRDPPHLSTAMFLGDIGGKQRKAHLNAFIDLEPSGARHLQPVRAATAFKEEDVVSLKVRELNEEALVALESVALELRRLDLSKTRMVIVPDALVTRLCDLRKLVLNFNRLTHLSFPESFGIMANLRELSVAYNQLTCIPKCWLKLRMLARLNLEGNKLTSLNGIDAFKRLAVLVLDNNQLEDLPKELCSLRRLEGLFAKRNRIAHIHAKIKSLRHLRVLNVSENKLETVSAEVFCLPKLEYLCLSHNQLSHLPTFSMQSFQGRRIALVDISENQLTRLPDHVLRVSDKLDLSNNKIKVIPGNIFKRYDKMTQQILDLRGNATVSPPSEVCEAGLRAIVRYCYEADQQSLIYQGAKVYVFGARGAGKTSLVRTFIDKEPQLAEPEEQTDGISVLDTISEITESMLPISSNDYDGKVSSSSVALTAKNLDEFSIKKSIVTTYWEFCGESHLIPLFSHFIREPALAIIAFDASNYKSHAFRSSIGVWVDLVCTRYFKAYMLLVATHVDKMSQAAVDTVCEQVLVDLRLHLGEKLQLIDRDVRNIETNSTISSTLSEYYSHLLRIKDVEIIKVHGKILQLSARTNAGYDELEDCLARVFKNMPTVYPHALKSHPTKFADIETYTEDLAEKAPLMEWDKYSRSVARKFNITVDKVAEVATYINLCGKVIWSPNDKFSSQHIVLRPQVLGDALLALINFQQVLAQSTSEESTQPSFTPLDPDDPVFGELSINHFIRHGLVNQSFLKYLWTRLTPVLNDDQIMPIAQLILENYELGFSADNVCMDELLSRDCDDRSSSSTGRPSTAKSDNGSIKQQPAVVANKECNELGIRVFLPAVKSKPTAPLCNELSKLNNENLQICAVYQIFTEGVPLLFERFCGRLRNSKMQIFRYWLGGVLARHAEQDHSIVRLEKQFLGDSPVMCIIVAAHCVLPTVTFPAINQVAKDDKSRVSSASGSTRSPYSSRPQSVHAASTEPRRPSIPSLPLLDNGTVQPTVVAPPYTFVDRTNAENMWTILLPILRDLDDLLSEYPGLWFRRMLRCPVCREICFNAEWASREFHEETELNCRACNNAVPLFLLSQPKEKRKVEDIAKLRRDMMDKRMKEKDTSTALEGGALHRLKRTPRLTKPQ